MGYQREMKVNLKNHLYKDSVKMPASNMITLNGSKYPSSHPVDGESEGLVSNFIHLEVVEKGSATVLLRWKQ